MMAERLGGWMLTAQGKQFWPLEPYADDLDARDIAHGLSLCCRFAGQCREFYSVAQHSVLVSDAVWVATGSKRVAFHGLMHDAAEAYLGDLVRPLKHALPDYVMAEKRLERVIAAAFGLEWVTPAAVKEADIRMLMTERRDLLEHGNRWNWETEIEARQPYAEPIKPWSWQESERRWLAAFHELTPDEQIGFQP